MISGETNLLDAEDLSSNMARLRELFKLFEQKTSLMQFLDISNRAQGCRIFIGGESGLTPLDDCSVVTAPYEGGRPAGGFGRRDRPHPDGLRPGDPDRGHHRRLLSSALSSQN